MILNCFVTIKIDLMLQQQHGCNELAQSHLNTENYEKTEHNYQDVSNGIG